MISVSNLTVSFGGVSLYEEVSFLVNARDRIGLAGKNGAGKSTLLKILCGHMRPDSGEVAIQSGATVGYLPQDMSYNLGKTVFAETATAFGEIRSLEKKLAEINEQLATRTDYDSESYMELIHKLNEHNERFTLLGGYSVEADIEKILLGLGFERTDFTRLTDEFSGGWRMRIELAKILLQKPDVLLLDEPTNHLDIESIQWLEEFLINYSGAVVLVSHDKAFLDNITTRTIEISLGKIYDYKANYSKYVILRKERKEQQEAAARNQQRYIDKTEQLIDKYRAKASKAAFAQSLIKKLDKLEVIEVDDEDNASIRFRFPPAPHSGKVVAEATDVKKQYGDKVIFSHVNFIIERQERIAFVGKNGEGKTTLSKLITGVEPFEGQIKLGHQVSIGYFAQNQAETLDGEKTVFETIDDVAVGDIRKNVRNLLGSFLFRDDDVDKKVKVLSGGEKSRLAMCKLLLQPYNLLVLDEPTNHLDMRSKDMLKQALMNYDGTLLVVSHDRDFLQGLTNKVFEFRKGNIKEHIGTLSEYLAARKINSLNELEIKQKPVTESKVNPAPKENFELKKQKDKELRALQNKLSKCEKEIERLENEIRTIDEQLMDPSKYQQVINDKAVFSKYEALKQQLDSEMKNWETLHFSIDNF